jgi:hypothetical protein
MNHKEESDITLLKKVVGLKIQESESCRENNFEMIL